MRRILLANSHLQMLLTLVIVLLANALAAQHIVRVDLSDAKLYSLDAGSKAVVQRLDRPITARVYFTPGLGAPYQNHRQFVVDKLNEFAAYSQGRMTVEVLDPAASRALTEAATGFGLQQLDYTYREQDRSELRKIWMGAVLIYGDRHEVLPSITALDGLEYQLASAFQRLATKRDDLKTLGWTVGHGEPDFRTEQGPVRTLTSELGKKFILRALPLGGAGSVPEEVDAVLVVGPQRPMSERALFQLDQFVMRGGALAAFVTNTRPDLKSMRPLRVSGGLEPLLGNFGVQVNRDLVLDRVQNGQMRFPVRAAGGQGYRELNFALIPKALELSPESVVVSGLDSITFPFASTISLAEDLPVGAQALALARSSASSGVVAKLETLDPVKLQNVLSSEKRGPFILMAQVKGAFRSFFETRGTPMPDPDFPNITSGNPDDDGAAPAESPMIIEGGQTRLIVAGSADVVASNIPLLLNIADWLVADEALLGIRGKVGAIPSLRPTHTGERTLGRVVVLGWVPVVLLAVGWWRRRR